MDDRRVLIEVIGLVGVVWGGALIAESLRVRSSPSDEGSPIPRRWWSMSAVGQLGSLFTLIIVLVGLALDLSPANLARLIGCAIVSLFVAHQFYIRYRTRSVRAALAQAQTGNTAGAVEDLRKEIASRGPSPARYNTLGVLLGLQGEWEDAVGAFRAAGHAGRGDPQLVSNLGVALWKTGRTNEALQLLANAWSIEPSNFTSTCHYCMILADTGHVAEATRYRDHAERLYHRQWVFAAADRAERRWLIEECWRLTESEELQVDHC